MLLPHRPLHTLLSGNRFLMSSKNLLKCFPTTSPLLFPRVLLIRTYLHFLPTTRRRPFSKFQLYAMKKSRFNSVGPPVLSQTVHSSSAEALATFGERLAALKMKLEKEGIACGSCVPGQYTRLLCPVCNGGDSMERSLSLFIREDGDLAMWNCFRAKCGWRGYLQASDGGNEYNNAKGSIGSKPLRVITEESLQLEPLGDQLIEYFKERMISAATLRRNGVMQRRYDHNQIAIAFTYRRGGKLVNCKYRDISKKFWQEKNTEKILYGLDDIKEASDIIIVEGEIDKLSMEEAGFHNCVSVPDGAPSKVSEKVPDEDKDTKYQYLWNCKEYFSKASRIILATDADKPGQALAEELARRLGRERCWRVRWPNRSDSTVFKDANEVLMFLGPEVLRQVIENAELYPIRGLFRFSDYFDDIDAYFYCSLGYEFGVSTGWKTVDHLYKVITGPRMIAGFLMQFCLHHSFIDLDDTSTCLKIELQVVPGELTIVTGVPNSGKSEWIDALLCNINENEQWTFALCSMENKVREHARKLLEKHLKKPFFNAKYGDGVERMSDKEFEEGKKWLNDTFYLIRCEDDCLPSIKWVLELAKVAVLRHGVRGLVIDPYNELDHQRPSSMTETEYVSQMLTKIKRFAQHHACHVWFVAHPRQLQHWVGGPPNLYDISGSAHFINKCDNGIVIHRNRDANAGPLDQVQVCVRKVRNKVIGNIGNALLRYNRATGEFMDIEKDEKT